MKKKLDNIKTDTQLIINLLKDKFIELDFDKIMVNFLQKELLNDQYVNLKQAGYSSEEDDVSLGRVFVDLPVSNERNNDPSEEKRSEQSISLGIVAQILNAANEHLDPQSLTFQSNQTHSEQLPSPSKYKRGRFAIIGGPGQGKTTLSQFVCQLFRAAILDKRPEVYYERVQSTLSEIKAFCHEENLDLPLIPRVPFRIILSDFATKLASNPSINSLFSYIVDRIRTRTNQEITTDHLRQWLTDYPWVIILDGLDEVPASSNRNDVLAAIDNFWIDSSGCNADVLVIATTRPQGFNDDFAPNIYQYKWLEPLSNNRAMHYAKRLVNVRYRRDQDRKGKIIERLQSALKDDATAKLMRSPLQVTIMTALVDRIGKPPQERWSLFQRYYTVIYHRETERDIPAASILRNYEPDINAIHYRVGLLLQIESEFSGRTGVRLSKDRFAALVEARLAEEGHEGKDLENLKQKIIEAAIDRLVFLVGLEANEVGFEIRSLQEFMAAEALMGANDTLLLKRLRQIAPIINWRNVFLFAAGKCFALEDRQHLRDTVRGICDELNESDKIEDEVFRVTLAGSQLALDLLEDGPAQRQPKYAKSLARLACRLWELPPNKNHTRLADLYDNQLEDVYIQELEPQLILVPTRLAAWQSLLHLSNKQISWAEKQLFKHWPRSEADLFDLFKIANSTGLKAWAIEKLLYTFSRFAPEKLFRNLETFQDTQVIPIEGPDWLNNFLKRKHPVAVSLHWNNTEKINNAIDINMLSNGNSEWIRAFKELSNPIADWLPFISAAKLIENPTKFILASELRNIVEQSSLKSIKWAADQLPWMFGSILEVANSKNELMAFADKVENGEFGDTGDWLAAESRWLAKGIGASDLDYMTNANLPFDKNIGQVGFPVTCLRQDAFSNKIRTIASELHQTTSPIPYTQLFALFEKYSGSILGSHLATATVWSIMVDWYLDRYGGIFSHKGSRESLERTIPLTFNQFQKMVLESKAEMGILIDSFDLFGWQNANSEEYLDFIDYVGRERVIFILGGMVGSSDSTKKLSKFFADIFIKDPNRLGVLNILSNFADQGISFSIPQYLIRPEKYSDVKFQEAAVIIQLTQQTWNQNDAKNLARLTLNIAKDNPETISRALKTITSNRIVGHSLEIYLLEILDNVTDENWEVKKEILDSIENSLRHRTSHLTEVWAELGLPNSLKKLVQMQEVDKSLHSHP